MSETVLEEYGFKASMMAPGQMQAAERMAAECATLRARVAEMEGERECFRHERDASLQREFATREQLTTARAEENQRLREALQELVDAMHRYEADAEGEQPASHRNIMRRAHAALAGGTGEG